MPNIFISTSETNSYGTVTSTSTTLVSANQNRMFLGIYNNTSGTVFLALGDTAVVNHGITIPVGNNFVINSTNLFLGDVNVVMESGTQHCSYTELSTQ